MKRFAVTLLALALAVTCAFGVAIAATESGISPRASLTITSTSVASYTGDNKGEVDFDYIIIPTRKMKLNSKRFCLGDLISFDFS